ncbi:MAG: amidohydrolase [Jaaginema sp. PMC 1079.18]|nr:amidohydrolase [Jaaginema sp. PMC 1080.18]MEC4850893.1 amidohydrolase [Jaaginema sp. PMC 1079.18]
MSFTIKQTVIPAAEGYTIVDVRIEGDRITAIAPDLDPVGEVIDGQNKLLLPGFVNAHTHSSEMWQRGMIPLYPLELWIEELHEFSPLHPKQIYLSALLTATETLLSGGTCVVDHLVWIPGKELESVAATVRAYQEIGMRAFIGPLIQDETQSKGIPDGGEDRDLEEYHYSTQQVLNLMEQAIAQFHAPETGIEMMVAPTGIQLCSEALFRGCVELSDRYNVCRHAHLLETKAQQLLAQEKYGFSAVEYLKQIGFLGDRTSLAHCVWLDDSDIEILAATHSTVVHNPLSNLRLGSGIAPILKYRQAGINVSFGCDGAASNDGQDLLEVLKVGSFLHNITDPDYRQWIAPREAVKMASEGGYQGIGLASEVGSLTEGKQADLVLYDLTQLSLLPRTDPISLLVMGRPQNVVDSVWVKGEIVVARGTPTRIDLANLRQQLLEHSEGKTNRQSTRMAGVEEHYRRVMNLPD